MKSLILSTFTVLLLILLSSNTANSQESKRALYQQQIEMLQAQGTYEPPTCLTEKYVLPTNANLRSSQSNNGSTNTISAAICDISAGYGTEGLVSSDATANANANDPGCSVTPPTACGGSNVYRVPIAVTVFEDQTWTGQNYLDNGGSVGGFLALSDGDINASIADLNAAYGNASIEFYEAVPRNRVQDADLFNFYRTSADPEDGVEDDGQTSAYDIANVINVYFVGGMDGDHDCCGTTGYAPYPPSRDYFLMVYRGTFGSTLEHEFGHYFGLAHTHVDGLSNGDTDTMLDNSDCLTTGDGICDTWPDPNFQNCRNSSCVYQQGGADCPALTIDPAAGVNQGGAVSTVLQDNIMSYNSFSGCRTSFSPCQYDKLQDVLLGCRANLCDATAVRAASTAYEICVGESAPTLSAISSCYSWYGDKGDGTVALATNTSSFTPSIGVGAGLLDNTTPGTYTFYIGDAIEYNPDCRTAVTISVKEDSGDGTTASNTLITGTSTIDLSTTGTIIGGGEIIGWLVSTTAPPAINNQAALDAYIGTGTLYESTSMDTDYSLSVTCAAEETYYASPIVSLKSAAAPTSYEASLVGQANIASDVNVLPIEVTQLPTNATLTQVCVMLDYNACEGFATLNDLDMSIEGPNGASIVLESFFPGSTNVGTPTTVDFCFVDDGSGDSGTAGCNASCFTGSLESDNSFNAFNGVDPNGTWSFTLNDDNNASFWPCEINIGLVFDMPANAITFPTITYSDCVIGNPVEITCTAILPIELTSFTAKKQGKTSLLNWETATETNNEYFTVERSMDGRIFTEIEELKGAGNSQTPIAYQSLDRNPENGINYYRLQQTDFDGKSSYSNIVSLTFTDLVELKVIPNPVAKNDILVEYHASEPGNLSIEIIDITGKIMSLQEFSATAGKNNLTMDITTFNRGIYILRTQQGNDMQTMRFVRL